MKKSLLLGVTSLLSLGAFAQLPVSTSPEMKNTVLEEFTGIYCGFCPSGHSIANGIVADNPDDVVVINIHAGGYAAPSGNDPDFRTPFGAAIDAQANVAGYPAGTVNREVFAGSEQNAGGTAMSRGKWAAASNTTLSQASFVNVALEGSIDGVTRELEVDVEMHFTGPAPASVNLNVALLQSHVSGPQSGGASNSAQILPDGSYEHNHMLRHLLTGQWGMVIDTTTTGVTISRHLTYTIPADLNGVDYELGNLEIVAFVAEGQQKIVTGAKGELSFTGFAANNANLETIENHSVICGDELDAKITFKNEGTTPITSMKIKYDVNGGTPVEETWTGSIDFYESASMDITGIDVAGLADGTLNFDIIEVNGTTDPNLTNNTGTSTFEQTVDHGEGTEYQMEFTQDRYGSEITWEFIDNTTGNVLASGGPYADLAANGTQMHTKGITVSNIGCHSMVVNDSYGDGINSGAGAGGYVLKNSEGDVVFSSNGQYGKGEYKPVQIGSLSVGVEELESSFELVPNPAKNLFSIESTYNQVSTVSVVNAIGQVMLTRVDLDLSEKQSFDISKLEAGIYFVNIKSNEGQATKRLVVK